MGKEKIVNNKNVDLKKLAKLIHGFFYSEKFSEVGLFEDPNGSWYQIQARKTGVLRTIASTRKALHVIIKGEPNSFVISVGTGEWGTNLAVGAMFTGAFSLIGMGFSNAFTNKLWKNINEFIEGLENSYQKPKEISKPQIDDSLLILKRRLALGEITKEEFEELSTTLGHEEPVEQEPSSSEPSARIIYD